MENSPQVSEQEIFTEPRELLIFPRHWTRWGAARRRENILSHLPSHPQKFAYEVKHCGFADYRVVPMLREGVCPECYVFEGHTGLCSHSAMNTGRLIQRPDPTQPSP